MALKKPWITCPGRWECAHDQGRAQSGELPPQQAKALPLSRSLLSVPRRAWKFSQFLSVGKTGGESIRCCGKWARRSRARLPRSAGQGVRL